MTTELTARNDATLARVKAAMNVPAYKRVRAAMNAGGPDAARAALARYFRADEYGRAAVARIFDGE